MTRILTSIMVAVIRAYQFAMRPLLVGGCRFVPHCSEYALEAISRHGPWRGAWLTVKRLARCHPFSGRSGFDPVP